MFIPFIIPVQQYPQYIKKEDLDWFIKKTHKGGRIINILVPTAVIVVQAIMVVFVLPKLNDVYATANKVVPNYPLYVVITSVIVGLVLIAYNSQSNPLDENKVEKLKQDKSDLISLKEPLINKKLQMINLAYMLVAVLALVASIVLPIYDLTSSY